MINLPENTKPLTNTEKRKGMPSKKMILDYWLLQAECGVLDYDLCIVDTDICFACGGKTEGERHHIVPLHMGGNNDVSNLIILCGGCHHEAPDTHNVDLALRWIAGHEGRITENLNEMRKHMARLGYPKDEDWMQIFASYIQTRKDVDKSVLGAAIGAIELYEKSRGRAGGFV